jgi:hypothetical protein
MTSPDQIGGGIGYRDGDTQVVDEVGGWWRLLLTGNDGRDVTPLALVAVVRYGPQVCDEVAVRSVATAEPAWTIPACTSGSSRSAPDPVGR